MLKQLLKYEFKATGRTYGGLYLALVALAVLSGFSLRSSSNEDFASLLMWFSLQTEDYELAIMLLTSLDKRIGNHENDILYIAQIALDNLFYDIA